jgi:DNA-binding LacI/PurR family transcriptional regulator
MRFDGIIVLYVPYSLRSYLYEEMERYQVPVVMLDNTSPESAHRGICVNGNDEAAMGLAVDYLVELGHRQIAMMLFWLVIDGWQGRVGHRLMPG